MPEGVDPDKFFEYGNLPCPVLKENRNVGIIGGGALRFTTLTNCPNTRARSGIRGLYTALILKDLGIPYEILEASSRVGGRLYTHHFQNQRGEFQYFVRVGMHNQALI